MDREAYLHLEEIIEVKAREVSLLEDRVKQADKTLVSFEIVLSFIRKAGNKTTNRLKHSCTRLRMP
jgi:hypothetical protein